MSDEEALDRFQRGLHPTIRMQVLTRFPSSTDEAMKLALAVEGAQQTSQAVLQEAHGFPVAQPQMRQHQYAQQPQLVPEYLRSSGVAPMDLDALRTRSPEAWQGPRSGGGNWRQPGYRRNNDTDKDCYNCGGWGHVSRNCPSPRRNRQQQGRYPGQGKGQARRD
ncbi:hypothetical protein BDB00DRAFT_880363 [Zychaea mexicana]|uniref:uncharacterized protein n=1 Tax=Zychaea mexicana TaxID=64656 RepID=UPI0022FEAE27|nr:uncharacterized protein BDB00DRAFT_880363 [Zychaea mexicana]KAI9468307.1 hypothetical protein BDB00DRAFT_880363 [Zychaea mexicana]